MLAVAAAHDAPVALASLDLTGLSAVNGALGPEHVDELLEQVTRALQRSPARPRVYFLGGSAFAALVALDPRAVCAVDLLSALTDLGQQLVQSASGPFLVDALPLELACSVGIAGGDAAALTVDDFLSQAEAARTSSPRRVNVAVAARSAAVSRDDLRLLGSVRGALERNELELHFQPLVRNERRVRTDPRIAALGESASGPAHLEVLVRWRHPHLGLLRPAAFLPLVEPTPLISALTEWVLRTALTQRQQWAAMGLDVHLAVNLSPNVLVNDDVPALVIRTLEHTGCPARRLTLEITESALVSNPQTARTTVASLRAMGVRVSLDDFGTGYTSLGLLRTLGLDEVKLDQTFITHVTSDPADAAIVATVLDLAHRLGLSAVAEGVHDEQTRDLLFALGYDLLQGFLFAPPMTAADALEWLGHSPDSPMRARGVGVDVDIRGLGTEPHTLPGGQP